MKRFAKTFTQISGHADLAAISVVITGLIGMSLGEWLLGLLPVSSVFARGSTMFGEATRRLY